MFCRHPTSLLQMNRPGKMVQRNERDHVCRENRFGYLAIMGQDIGGELAATRFDPGPGNGETKNFAPEIAGQPNILGITIPEIGCSPTRSLTLVRFPLVPEIRVIRVIRFGLMIRSCYAKQEIW
jgi:hypothetical protein